MEVIKRDGTVVPYDLEKISIAIGGAFLDYGQVFDDVEVLEEIDRNLQLWHKEGYSPISIEDIQDLVEDILIEFGYIEIAKEYIKHRYKHALLRKAKLEAQVEAKLLAKQIDNQNANIDEHSFGGRMGEANDLVMKQYALEHCVSKMARENHEGNMIYIHDLSHYAVGDHNCLSVPFDKLLANGFNTRQTDVRPANSVNTAFQLVAVIFQLQSLMQFGGVSATHLDWTMVPYVRKSFFKHFKEGCSFVNPQEARIPYWDKEKIETTSIHSDEYKYWSGMDIGPEYKYALYMTKREVHQAVEGMYHNLNTLQSRSGN